MYTVLVTIVGAGQTDDTVLVTIVGAGQAVDVGYTVETAGTTGAAAESVGNGQTVIVVNVQGNGGTHS